MKHDIFILSKHKSSKEGCILKPCILFTYNIKEEKEVEEESVSAASPATDHVVVTVGPLHCACLHVVVVP